MLSAALVLVVASSADFGVAKAQSDEDGNSNNSKDSQTQQSPSAVAGRPFKTAIVAIPRGAANPTPDLTLQSVGDWYEPRKVTISSGDTVTWQNNDTEPHTVTSGWGAGIASVQTNEKGKPDGTFDSQFFGAGKSWSRAFYVPGTYAYFCTIHPWMEGIVVVNPVSSKNIPTYAVDAAGNKQEAWPVHTFSDDGSYDIDMKWDPSAIMTGKTATFLVDFFDAKTNERLQLTPFDFVVLQDGKEIERTYGLTNIGTAVYRYEFSKPGPITLRVEKVGDKPGAWSQFTTFVYPDPEASPSSGVDNNKSAEVTKISGGTPPASRLINPVTLVTFTYGVIFGIPAAAGIVILLYKKGKI